MKKTLTTLVTVFAIAQCSYAQWSTGSGTIYPTTISNKLGIGTTNPLGTLHVKNTSYDFLSSSYSIDIGLGGSTGAWARAFRVVNSANSNGQDGGAFGVMGEGTIPNFVYMSIPTSDVTGYNSTKILTLNNAGNVGIGTTSPSDLLTLNAGTSRKGITIGSDGNASAYSDIVLAIKNTSALNSNDAVLWDISHRKDGYFSGNPSGKSSLEFYGVLKNETYISPLSFKSNGDIILASSNNTAFSGNVGIGTTSPDAKLAVKGKIHSEEVIVDLSVPGPDYVFEPEYKLQDLTELKAYLDKNHHLPEVPSAKEMEKDGISLSDMNMKLLKKVEELTLYLIAQNEENQKLKEEQQKANKLLQDQINELAEKK